MSIITREFIQANAEFYSTKLDCSDDSSKALSLVFKDVDVPKNIVFKNQHDRDDFERTALIRHFNVLWANREGICATQELANIRIDVGGLAYTGYFKVTLGQLLYLYNNGDLRGETCEVCHDCFMLECWFSGSALSGSGQHAAFCPLCGFKKYYRPLGRDWRCFYNGSYQPSFDTKTSTQWTVTTLLHALDSSIEFINF